MGLPQNRRIKSREGFDAAFTGVLVRSRAITAHTIANRLGLSRLGVVVSKRNVPKATNRNKIKRLVREAFRITQDATRPIDVVVKIRRPEGSKQVSLTELISLLSKI